MIIKKILKKINKQIKKVIAFQKNTCIIIMIMIFEIIFIHNITKKKMINKVIVVDNQ